MAIALFGVACGDDGDGGDEGAAAEAAVRAAIQAWNDEDLDGFLSAFTDEGITALFAGFSREEVTEFFSEDGVGDPQIEIQKVHSSEAEGDQATVDFTTIEGAFQHRQRVTLIKQDDVWLGNDFEPQTQEVPDDTVAVDIDLVDYGFEFDRSQITSGNLAFNISNTGEEPHELVLSRVPADLDIEEALQSEEEPEGVEDIGFAGPWVPGTNLTSILVDELEPGRYVMLCFIPDAEGTPHALKGMWAEFTVE